MSFRKSAQTELEKWRESNASKLTELGFPEVVVANHSRFVNAVLEEEDLETKWHIGWIKTENYADLYQLLSEKFSAEESYLVSSLKNYLAREHSHKP